MGRIAGRRGRLYVGLASGAASAEPVTFLNKWSLNFPNDDIDVTSFDDENKTYVAGLPDAQGDFGGFYDNATGQLYAAASDGAARKFYLYPDNALTSQYWFGTASFDFSVSGEVNGAVEISGNFKAGSRVQKVG